MRIRAIAAVLAVSTALTVVGATAAEASRHSDSTLAGVAPASLHAAGGPGAVPWSTVGAGWLLATWSPTAGILHGQHNQYVVLVAPVGTRYLIAKLAPTIQLLSWSGDGQRALLTSYSKGGQALLILDLHTGAISSAVDFAVSNASIFFSAAGFTRPSGLALVVSVQANNHEVLKRYSLSGATQHTYPVAFSALGRFTGGWLSSPTGTQLVLGARHGLAVVDNDGTVVTQLRVGGTSWCTPVRWWTAAVVLATCGSPNRLYDFSLSGGARALTRVPRPPDDGDLGAWHVGTGVYVQVASACGYLYLAQLHGATPVQVQVPGVRSGASVYVVGASDGALALAAARVAGCGESASLQWFRPATRSVQVVLGPPITSGSVNNAVIFPSPFG